MIVSILFDRLSLMHYMTKKKRLSSEEKIINSLNELPNPLEDRKHRILIYFTNNRARSNETRFEHISLERHILKERDIKRIREKINQSILKKDPERKDTYNIYIKRNNYNDEYIKISLELNFRFSNKGIVKTIFITKNKK